MHIEEYFEYLEEAFKDPNNILEFEDTRPLQHFNATIIHSRSAALLSPREQFMYKYVLVNTNGQNADQVDQLWASIAISAIHGDGKGSTRIQMQGVDRYQAQIYREKLVDEFKPISVDEGFGLVQKLVKILTTKYPDAPHAAWAEQQLNGRTRGTKATVTQVSKSNVFSTEPSLYGLPLGRTSDGKVVSYTGNRALVTIAPPDSGKSIAQALPALGSFAGHVFVLDLKGYLYEQTASNRRRQFDSRIINFNPRSADTARYNPLHFISSNPDDCLGDASIFAQLVVPIRNTRDPTWDTMAQRVLSLYVAYTVLTRPLEQRKMSAVLDLVAGIGTDEALAMMTDPDAPFSSAIRRSAATVQAVRRPESHAQYAGVLQALEQNLGVWNDPRVERATETSDWSPMDFRGSKPLSLYLTIPLDSVAAYGPLIRVITTQHVNMLTSGTPQNGAVPILFLLDEFPQMGRMEPIKKAVEYGRQHGLMAWLFAQFAQQFEETYGPAGKGLIEICGVRTYMNPTTSDAQMISKEFGSPVGPLQEKKQPIMPYDAIIGPQHRDSVFVLSSNETPLVLKKNFPTSN